MSSVTVTLTFSSIDAAIAALREIPEAAVQASAGTPAPAPAKETATAAAGKPAQPAAGASAPGRRTAAGEAGAAPAKTARAQESSGAADAAAAPQASTAAADKVEYAALQKATVSLALRSRAAATEVVSAFGVNTFKDLDPARWAEALNAVNAKLAELDSADEVA